jgi:tartronate-semialdehyde synthase
MKENHEIMDYVKVAQGFGCDGERVFIPEDIIPALRRAQASGKPYVVDIVCDENQDCSMGNSIDTVKEF